jgi:hypothetical protein
MPYYAVHLERSEHQTIYVQADDEREATEAAWELASPNDWVEDSEDADVHRLKRRPKEPYWTGGEEGHWAHPPVKK